MGVASSDDPVKTVKSLAELEPELEELELDWAFAAIAKMPYGRRCE